MVTRPRAVSTVRRVGISSVRDQVRDRHVFDDALVNRLADAAAAAEPRHDAQRDALEGCLEKLPPAQRELVLSAYAKGTRIDGLASRRGQTPMSLYKVLHRIRQALLECVRRQLAMEGLQ